MCRMLMGKLNQLMWASQLRRQSGDSLSSLSNHIALFYIDFERFWEGSNIIRPRIVIDAVVVVGVCLEQRS